MKIISDCSIIIPDFPPTAIIPFSEMSTDVKGSQVIRVNFSLKGGSRRICVRSL